MRRLSRYRMIGGMAAVRPHIPETTSKHAGRWAWLPNALTLARLLALPGVVWALRTARPFTATAIFLAAMATDVVDGALARRLGATSRLGLYLDPVVDKIVVLGLLYQLAAVGCWPIVVAHLFLARELLHNGVRAAAAARGHVVGANWMGKTKALLQTALITAALLPGVPAAVLRVAAWTVVVVAWVFFAAFLCRNRRVLTAA